MNITPLNLVAAWHARFQVALPDVPTFDPDVIALRIRLLLEEKNELLHAIATHNRVEQLDALCDLQYVLSGAVLHLGLRKRFVDNGMATPFRGGMPFFRNESEVTLTVRIDIFTMKVKALAKCAANNGEKAIRMGVLMLTDCQILLDGLIEALGFADVFADAFRRVDENNHGKMWTEYQVKEWINQEFDTTNTDVMRYFTQTTDGFIARDAFGKIIKPVGFGKVSLEEFVK